MSPDELWASLPPELRGRYETYITLLTKWQKSINLVAPSTIPDARDRHVLDSYQLVPHISPAVKTIYDLGSGAGFPALVIGAARSDIVLSCLESDGRKCEFLRTISREINIPVTIHMGRIEGLEQLPPPDMITARALASLKVLLDWTRPWWSRNVALELLLPKGESWEDEVKEASAHYSFEIAGNVPSVVDPRGRILRITRVETVKK